MSCSRVASVTGSDIARETRRARAAARGVVRAAGVLVAAAVLSAAWSGPAWAGQLTEFSAGIRPYANPAAITAGPDGNLWFTESFAQPGRIGRITPAGVVTEFPTGPASTLGITVGPDRNLWFSGATGIGRITRTGKVTMYPVGNYYRPFGAEGVNDITTGPDGALWFTGHWDGESFSIGRITPSGALTRFNLPNVSPSRPAFTFTAGISAGPDGNVWFTEPDPARIGRITPAGKVTEFDLTAGARPMNITAGPDGNLWFAEDLARIGRITPTGRITEFSAGMTSAASAITAGPDGNLWFPESALIGRITPAGKITEYDPRITADAGPGGITTGPDGNLWFTETGAQQIARFVPTAAKISPGKAFKLPSAHRCVSRRHFTIRIRKLPGVTWKSAKVYVNGKRVKTVKRSRITAPVDLRGLPKGRYTVTIVAKTTDGSTVKGKRRYRTCAGAGHHHHPPKL